jgi:hypothetical protein
VSNEGRGIAAEHALRSGEALRMRAGAGDTGGTCGGSGGGSATWRGQEQASVSRGSGGADAGAARGARKGGAGAVGERHMAGEAASVRQAEKQRSGGRRRRIGLQFPKSAGTPL